jgi:hypothetical protein
LRAGTRFTLECVLKGGADPVLLADSGLANRLRCYGLLQKSAASEFSKEGADTARLRYTLGVAESRFMYFCGRCQADVDSARRAGVLAFILSLVMAAYSAFPIYLLYFNNSKHGGSSSAFWTARDVVMLLGYGWLCTAVLYFASSLLDRALAERRICWAYFCARLKTELSCE